MNVKPLVDLTGLAAARDGLTCPGCRRRVRLLYVLTGNNTGLCSTCATERKQRAEAHRPTTARLPLF